MANTPIHRWFQFRLRTLLIAVAIIGVGCAWVGDRYFRGRLEHVAVETLKRANADATYDYEDTGAADPTGPKWLRSILGDEFFNHVVRVHAPLMQDASVFENLKALPYLSDLTIGPYGNPIASRQSNNKSSGSLPDLSGLMHLTRIEIQDFPVDDRGMHLDGVQHLETLHLLNTRCTGSCLRFLPAPERLKDCSILGNPETNDETMAALDRLRELEYLGLTMEHMGSGTMQRIGRLKKLRWLALRAPFSDEGLGYLAGLKNLKGLDLVQSPVTDGGIRKLSGLKKLSRIDLWETKVTPAGAKALQQLMPHCVIKLH